MARYLAALEQAAEREIQAAPHRRQEIEAHYQSQADTYFNERKSEKRLAHYRAALWFIPIGAACMYFGFQVRLVFMFGLCIFVCATVSAIRQKSEL
ncbi:MAG: hypothetical protein WCS99_16570 [Limisphaerales bacterium]